MSNEELVRQLIETVIPIYTDNKKDENGKIDCMRVRLFKEGMRYMMQKKIEEITTYYDQKSKDGHQ